MKKYLFLIFGIATFQSLFAQEKSGASLGTAVSDAVNPLAFITKLQFQSNFSWKTAGAKQLNLTGRIIQPSTSVVLPFLKSKNPSKIYTIYRLEMPIVGQTFPANNVLNATGISDLILLDVVAFKQNWGLLGIGPGLIIPIASSQVLGGGKWCAGISGVVLNTQTKGIQWGFLAQQFFSFAGESTRPKKNFMLFQPIFNKILGSGFFLQISPIMNFDWENNQYNIPISVGLGKAFARNLSMNIAPEYLTSGPNKNEITLRLNINTMFPPLKK